MFILNSRTVCKWLMMTEFEMLINLMGITASTILLALKVDEYLNLNWRAIFMPLFVADALQAYFCLIVVIRLYFDYQKKKSLLHGFSTGSLLILRFISKLLFYILLSKEDESYPNGFKPTLQQAMTPLFVHLTILGFRTFYLKKFKTFE
jgi:ribonuclease P/MRP protein subunit RPP20